MLSLPFIRENADTVRRAISEKGVALDLDALLALDAEVREIKTRTDELRRQRNAISDGFKSATAEERPALGQKAKAIGAEINASDAALGEKQAALDALLLRVPNIPWEGAPVGPDESANVVVRQEGTVPTFDFEPLDHVALIERNDWADLGRITQVSGSRTYCLKGRLALLEQALMLWAQRRLADDGFTLMTVPALARPQAFVATGHFPGHEEEAYHMPADDLYLAGTGEIALTSLHSGEIVEAETLPILYAGYSPCFRREAGSAGRDVRGLLRVHQFYKLEQYVICRDDPAESARWHARLLANAEAMLEALEIPYQVIEASTGDMGNGKFRMNDIESWVPSLGKYRETHSCSTLHDWQARRANLRWRDEERKVRFAHTLNNTALASPRILVPLLENHQTADGRVLLPEPLRELMGGGEYL
ncbi:serine--tRNA ligase [Sphingosinicella terrae]|uniref:serine--tRNA ligase n=1 Tax=Sphingosinicella terrae TaxID=2172047 RepID=UPI000E0D9CDD|nr:serine--tRNA ligase [Sphingosinicella terrae]